MLCNLIRSFPSMKLSLSGRLAVAIFWALSCHLFFAQAACFASGREVAVPDIQFQPIRPTRAVTLRQAVDIALQNYPAIANKVFKLRAAKANVSLAKMQYLPNLNIDVQESIATPNTVASLVMNNVSGFDTVPVNSGPEVKHMTMKPVANNLQGLNFNWLLFDQGLRHANDNFDYADARTARADINLTKLDVALATADAFLDAVSAKQAIISTTAELQHMEGRRPARQDTGSTGAAPGGRNGRLGLQSSRDTHCPDRG